VLMTVAGGLRNRTGIVIASAFTALLDLLVRKVPGVDTALQNLQVTLPVLVILIGAGVLVAGALRRRPVNAGVGAAVIAFALIVLSPVTVPMIEPHLNQLPDLTASTFRILVLPVIVLVTLVTAPGGLGQQIRPIQRWLGGHRFDLHAAHYDEVVITDVRA